MEQELVRTFERIKQANPELVEVLRQFHMTAEEYEAALAAMLFPEEEQPALPYSTTAGELHVHLSRTDR